MSLYKRGNTLWSYVWIDGVRYCKSTGTANRRIAETIDQQFKTHLNLKRHQIPEFNPDMTFGELFARFAANGGPKPYHIDRAKMLLPYHRGTLHRNAPRRDLEAMLGGRRFFSAAALRFARENSGG